jgi:acyl carrier protein
MNSPAHLRDIVLEAIADSCHRTPADLHPDVALADLAVDSIVILSIVASIENATQRRLGGDDLLELLEAERVGEFADRLLALAGSTAPD